MLQRHQLLAEFDALFDSDKEKYAPFEDILRAAQVTLLMCLLECLPIENQVLILISLSAYRKQLCFPPGLHLLSGQGLVSGITFE